MQFFSDLYGEVMRNKMNSIWTLIGSLGKSPLDFVLNCYVLPATVAHSEDNKIFNLGWFDSNIIQMPVALSRYKMIDMGEVHIDEYWGNALDYEADIQIFLPYINYQALDARTVMGKTLHLVY